MKRVLAVILALLSVTAFAESIDVASMSTDDLLSLRKEINLEIQNRLEQQSGTMYEGVYVAGVDIPVGSYLATYVPSEYALSRIWVYDSLDAFDEDRMNPRESYDVDEKSQVRIGLREGMVMRVMQSPCDVQSLPTASWEN